MPTKCAKSPPSSTAPSTNSFDFVIFRRDCFRVYSGHSRSLFRRILLYGKLLPRRQPRLEMFPALPAKILQENSRHSFRMILSLFCRAHGQRAVATLRKAFRFYGKRVVKPRPVIFPGQRRCEFYQLRVGELFPELRKERVWNFDGSLRHAVGVLQHQLFRLRKEFAVAVVG